MPIKDWNREKNCKIGIAPNYPKVFDCILIGAGPAGMTAAVYAARRKMKTLFLTGNMGGQMSWSSDLQNWTGIIRTTGPLMAEQMMNHVKMYRFDRGEFDLYLEEGLFAEKIEKNNGIFTVFTKKGVFEAKSIILSVGKRPRMLGIKGESIAQKGRGLSFSTTSDAPLYRGKKMVIIGGANSAMDCALQLVKLTDDITIMTNLSELKGETCLIHRVLHNPKIKVECNVDVQEIVLQDDESWVKGIKYRQNEEREVKSIECEGIFEAVGQVPSTAWLQGFVDLDARGYIVTDADCRASISGVFAAGDCNTGTHKQVVVAAGEGAKAALEAHAFVLE